MKPSTILSMALAALVGFPLMSCATAAKPTSEPSARRTRTEIISEYHHWLEWAQTSPQVTLKDSYFSGQHSSTVLYIEDAHAAPCQNAVEVVLSDLHRNGFKGFLGLEGVVGEVSPAEIQEFERRNATQTVHIERFMMENPLLQHPELYKVIANPDLCDMPSMFIRNFVNLYGSFARDLFGNDVSVVGVDNREAYLKSAVAYAQTDIFIARVYLDTLRTASPELEPQIRAIDEHLAPVKECLGVTPEYIPFLESADPELHDARTVSAVTTTLSQMRAKGDSSGALIFGLYHNRPHNFYGWSATITDELKKHGTSYLVVQPSDEVIGREVVRYLTARGDDPSRAMEIEDICKGIGSF